jgi:F-type H+-transporting ATPase subunit b
MLIDWFTVGAQAINFIILIWLMKHFLYKPILKSIETREKLIAQELADAALKEAEAKKSLEQFQQKKQELEQQRAAILSSATEAAKVAGAKLLDTARKQSDALRSERLENLRNEMHDLSQSIESKVDQEVFQLARKVLRDLADTSLEGLMFEVFTKHLREINGRTKETLAAALHNGNGQCVIRSAFELSANQKANLQNVLNESFSADVPLRYETDTKLISGIELIGCGQKLVWCVDDYLGSLKDGLDEILSKRAESQSHLESDANLNASDKLESNSESKSKSESKPKSKSDSKPDPGSKVDSDSQPMLKPDHSSQNSRLVSADSLKKPVSDKIPPADCNEKNS